MTGFLGSSDPTETAIARIGGPEMPAPFERRPLDDGTRKLRLAVLMGAAHDYRSPRLRTEVLEWIQSDSDRGPFDFATIAVSFGYAPDRMRRWVLRLLAQIDSGSARQFKRRPARRCRQPKPARTRAQRH
jgi:hypothetical protein